MKKIIYIIIVCCLLSNCMAKPKQPPLTPNETIYFKQLSKKIKSDNIYREIDPKVIKRDKSKVYTHSLYYAISIYTSCSILEDSSKLSLSAESIAKELISKVFSHEDRYSDIYISFNCHPIKRYTKSISYEFKVAELSLGND